MSTKTLSFDSVDDDFDNRPSWANRGALSTDSGKSTLRSLECSSINVEITETEVLGRHMSYVVMVESGISTWIVNRRYSDFVFLDKGLIASFPGQNLPPLPPRRFLGSSTDARFVEDRKINLEAYLRALVSLDCIWTISDYAKFLDNKTSCMMFLWNFERMRKMQDMLSSMKYSLNEDQAEKLNAEYTEAQVEVAKLQTRLSQMEMIFLQQATGVAQNKLSASVIRTMSGAALAGADTLTGKLQREVTAEHEALYDGSEKPTAPLDGASSEAVDKGSFAGTTVGQAGSSSSVSNLSSALDQLIIDTSEDIVTRPRVQSDVFSIGGGERRPSTLMKSLSGLDLAALQDVLVLSNEMLAEKIDVDNLDTLDNSGHSIQYSPSGKYESPRQAVHRIGASDSQSPSDSQTSRRVSFSSLVDGSNPSSRRTSSRRPSAPILDSAKQRAAEQDLFNAVAAGLTAPPNEGSLKLFEGVQTWSDPLLRLIYFMLEALSPTPEALTQRYVVFRFIRDIVSSVLNVHLLPIGSFCTHTFLPDGELDTTVLVIKPEDEPNWFVKVNEALCMALFRPDSSSSLDASKPASMQNQSDNGAEGSDGDLPAESAISTISNISFFNEAKMIKSLVNNIGVNVTANQVGSLYAQSFLDKIDAFIGQNSLFKRSLLLVKAWGQYESPRHTNGAGMICMTGRLSSWAMAVMLTWIFNLEGARVSHPLQALGHFLRYFSSFDWELCIISVRGPLYASDLSEAAPRAACPYYEYAPTPTSRGNNGTHSPLSSPLSQTVSPLGKETSSTPSDSPVEASGGSPLFIPDEVLDYYRNKKTDARKGSAALSEAPELVPSTTTTVTSQGALSDACSPTTTTSSAATTEESGAVLVKEASPKVPSRSIAVSKPSLAAFVKSALPESDLVYEWRAMGVMDPVDYRSNITKEVDEISAEKIRNAMVEGYKQFQNLCENSKNLQSYALNANAMLSTATDNAALLQVMQMSLFMNTVPKVNIIQKDRAVNSWWNRPVSYTPSRLIASQDDELQFSLHYVEFILGGKIDHHFLVLLIEQILLIKGPMPVGEIGKNLQLLSGSDCLSRRLKEQYSGLKKAIETSGSQKLRVGVEHPYNPVVSLLSPTLTVVTEEDATGLQFDSDASDEKAQAHTSAAVAVNRFAHITSIFRNFRDLKTEQKSAQQDANGNSEKNGGGKNSNAGVNSKMRSNSFNNQQQQPQVFRRKPPMFYGNNPHANNVGRRMRHGMGAGGRGTGIVNKEGMQRDMPINQQQMHQGRGGRGGGRGGMMPVYHHIGGGMYDNLPVAPKPGRHQGGARNHQQQQQLMMPETYSPPGSFGQSHSPQHSPYMQHGSAVHPLDAAQQQQQYMHQQYINQQRMYMQQGGRGQQGQQGQGGQYSLHGSPDSHGYVEDMYMAYSSSL
jgi:hypothetical protein